MSDRKRELPPFKVTLGAVLIAAKEAVVAPLRPMLRKYDITEPQWRVLRVINDGAADDATSIADAALLRAPSVTRILRELELRGLVERRIDPDDRRRSIVALAPRGHDQVRAISHDMAGLLDRFADAYGGERTARLIAELNELTALLTDD